MPDKIATQTTPCAAPRQIRVNAFAMAAPVHHSPGLTPSI